MITPGRRWLAAIGAIVIAALLAFLLRDAVYQLIVLPLAYVFWLLKLFYLSFDQILWWIAVVIVILLILGRSLLPELKPLKPILKPPRPSIGPVQSLAGSIQKSNKGIYFKWLVANRLGRLAYQMLVQREHGKPRSIFAPLTSEGWESPPDLQTYLEKGLHGSFADFPNSNWNYFSPPIKTPLDHDIAEAIEFLESQQGDSHFR